MGRTKEVANAIVLELARRERWIDSDMQIRTLTLVVRFHKDGTPQPPELTADFGAPDPWDGVERATPRRR
jgi:hypothetical protein